MPEVREVAGFKWFVPDEPYKNLPLDDWEVMERIWIRDNIPRGVLFLDIGANSGVYSITLAEHFDMVCAIEPDKMNAAVLAENMKLNGVTNLSIIRKAAWSKCQMLTYQLAEGYDTASGAVAWDGPNPYHPAVEEREVAAITVDSLDLNPSVIKIDVEGAEQHVLLGAVQTLLRCHPVVLIEVHDDKYIEFTKLFMELLGYTLTNPEHFKRLHVQVYRMTDKEG